MAVGLAVATAGYVNPEVLAVGGLENQLVEVSVVLKEVKPLTGGFEVCVTFVVVPSGIVREWQLNIRSLTESML